MLLRFARREGVRGEVPVRAAAAPAAHIIRPVVTPLDHRKPKQELHPTPPLTVWCPPQDQGGPGAGGGGEARAAGGTAARGCRVGGRARRAGASLNALVVHTWLLQTQAVIGWTMFSSTTHGSAAHGRGGPDFSVVALFFTGIC